MSYFGPVQWSRLIFDSGQQTITVTPGPGQNTIGSDPSTIMALAVLTIGYDDSSETDKTPRLQIKLIIVYRLKSLTCGI